VATAWAYLLSVSPDGGPGDVFYRSYPDRLYLFMERRSFRAEMAAQDLRNQCDITRHCQPTGMGFC